MNIGFIISVVQYETHVSETILTHSRIPPSRIIDSEPSLGLSVVVEPRGQGQARNYRPPSSDRDTFVHSTCTV